MNSTLTGFFLFMIFAVQILLAAPPIKLKHVPDGYRFELNLEDPVLRKEYVNAVTRDGIRINETFVRAYVYGFDFDGIEGDPALLSSDIEFAFENNVPVVTVTDVITQDIPLEGKLYPMQPSKSYHGSGRPPFAYNPDSYKPGLAKKDATTGYVTVSKTYTYRGQKSATISIKPLTYTAGTNIISIVKRLNVTVKMDEPQVLHSWNSKAFDQVMRASYANLGYAAEEPFSPMEKYLIITMPNYRENTALKEFIDYRSRLYDVKVIGTDEVGGTTINAFRDLIRGEKPAFCLLVGNQSAFPSWKPAVRGEGGGWDDNGWKSFNYYVASQISSSSEAPHPDIALGLFYVDNAQQIANIVRKTISTEENLPTRPKVILGQGGNNEKIDNLPPEHCDDVVKEIVSRYFLPDNGWRTCIYPTQGLGEGARKAVDQFNKGCWFNFYNGHGFTSGQDYGWDINDLSSMTNSIYPFVLNCCCETGSFDQNCVASVAVGNSHGPVTVIAAYGISYQGQHVLNQGYPDGIIDKKITKSGLAFVYAVNYDSVPKCYINWAGIPSRWDRATMGWQFHHFGDPAIETMASVPAISLTTPEKGDLVEQDKEFLIRWSTNITGNVSIDLCRNGIIAANLSTATAAPAGMFNWRPARTTVPADNYQIRVTSLDSSALCDTSGSFSIIPEYVLTAPYYQSFDTLDSGSTVLPLKYSQDGDTADALDWYVWKGPTPSRSGGSPDTGPQSDKTSGNGNYLYIEASGVNSPDKKAVFTTPNFDLSSGEYSLSFWVHMYSASNTMGTLSLDICVDGTWNYDAVKITGNQGDKWIEQTLPLEAYRGERVSFRFRGVTGEDRASDIGIDDFSLRVTGNAGSTQSAAVFPEYGNPIFTRTSIILNIPEAGAGTHMKIILYNARGQQVRTLLDGCLPSGEHVLKPGLLAGGLYIITMKNGKDRKTFNFLYAN